ncbi:MAG TPA: sugar ABC transporter substrate-binding protein [Anaerolineae bacterium]|nr:sugar ABC transporter substrate-binding protein [Anaerolineae bacterium]
MTRRITLVWRALIGLLLFVASACGKPPTPTQQVTLRLGVALTPQELASFQPAMQSLGRAHPEWKIILETVPQQGAAEKINAELAGNTLPDVLRLGGLSAQQWIRQNAFLDLSARIQASALDLNDFYSGPLDQFRWQGTLWGLPDTAAPDVVFYNKAMFRAAGLACPSDDWTYEDMRRAAIRLTLDRNGRHAGDPGFDPESIQQWGWSGGWSFFWQRPLVQALGGELCANDDCTQMTFTSPATLEAARWWASLVAEQHAGLYDPFGGSQTGVPGDAFIAGKAAMGYTGFFAVGQLNEIGSLDYDVVQPFRGVDGHRYTTLSTNGYVISATTQHPDAAWALLQALVSPEFLAETWGTPGHSVPARRSVASSAINPAHPPAHQQAIVAALDYATVFMPYTASAYEVNTRTADLFQKMMKGDLSAEEAMRQIEATANQILARDR